jgi:hypothetical protein
VDWTANQRRFMMVYREVRAALNLCKMKDLPDPKPKTFRFYRTFRKWRDWVEKTERNKTQNKQHTQGWVLKK